MAIQMPAEVVSEDVRLQATMRSGAGWFYWVAGLSLVNTVMTHTGSDVNFLMGLAYTLVVDGIAQASMESGGPIAAIRLVAIGLDVVIAGAFVLFGLFGQRGKAWAFLVGIALYALDAAVFAYFASWANVAFHAFAGLYLVRGFLALRRLTKLAPPAASATVDLSTPPGDGPRRNPLVR